MRVILLKRRSTALSVPYTRAGPRHGMMVIQTSQVTVGSLGVGMLILEGLVRNQVVVCSDTHDFIHNIFAYFLL